MDKDLTGSPAPGSSTTEGIEEPTSDSPQGQGEEARAVAQHPSETGPVDHVPAGETGLNSPAPDTRSLSQEPADDRRDHLEPEVATKPAAVPSSQEQTLALASPAGSHDLAPRTSAPLQRSDGSDLDSKLRALATAQPDLLADMAYVNLANKLFPAREELEQSALATLNFQRQMCPKDALERLALTMVLMTHGRVAWLTTLATSQTDVPSIVAINEACDRASGAFVRLTRAIGEYRQPTNPGTAISIGQANLAQQQVVQNIQEVQERKNVDERTRIRRNSTAAGAEAAETLPAIEQGAAVAPDRRLANPAVDEEHRPQKPGRKGANQQERPKTRRTVRRQRRAAETDEGDTEGTGAND